LKFKFFGCTINITLFFMAMLALLLYFDKSGMMLLGIGAIFIHETGHLIMMKALRRMPEEIILQPAGVIIKTKTGLTGYHGDILIALSGCAANGIAAILSSLIYVNNRSIVFLLYSLINTIMALFNLIPVEGLDGGDVLRFLLQKKLSITKADKIVKVISFAFIVIIIIFGIYLVLCKQFNVTILFSGFYLTVLMLLNLRE